MNNAVNADSVAACSMGTAIPLLLVGSPRIAVGAGSFGAPVVPDHCFWSAGNATWKVRLRRLGICLILVLGQPSLVNST